MKFGKRIKEQIQESLPEWRDKFLRYKELKNLISSPAPSESIFVGLLNDEIDKFNAFFVEQEEDFIIHHKVWKKKKKNWLATTCSEFLTNHWSNFSSLQKCRRK